MLTREQYALSVRHFLGELSVRILQESDSSLAAAPELLTEIEEALGVLRLPESSRAKILAAACGLVDEYTQAFWDEVVADAYEDYIASH